MRDMLGYLYKSNLSIPNGSHMTDMENPATHAFVITARSDVHISWVTKDWVPEVVIFHICEEAMMAPA